MQPRSVDHMDVSSAWPTIVGEVLASTPCCGAPLPPLWRQGSVMAVRHARPPDAPHVPVQRCSYCVLEATALIGTPVPPGMMCPVSHVRGTNQRNRDVSTTRIMLDSQLPARTYPPLTSPYRSGRGRFALIATENVVATRYLTPTIAPNSAASLSFSMPKDCISPAVARLVTRIHSKGPREKMVDVSGFYEGSLPGAAA